MRLAFLVAALFGLGCGSSLADNWANTQGETPIDVRFSAPLAAQPGETLVVKGAVSGEKPATLVLRVDDSGSADFASRANVEQLLPPGPFVWRYPLAGVKASGGRVLDARDIRRLVLFEPGAARRVAVDSFTLEPAPRLPEGSVGFSLGAADAPLIGGLSRIAPDDPRVIGRHPVAIRRPSPDPVVANGVNGVERLHVDWPRGRARVSLWLEDVGEWETLPSVLQRRVRVNGRDFVNVNPTPQQWVEERYLAGREREASAADDAWTAFGRHRGGLVSHDVDVGDGGVDVELAGSGAAATFLSAIVIEPAGRVSARDFVEAARRQWMTENFPVAPARAIPLPPVFGDDAAPVPKPLRVVVTPGTGARLAFAVGGRGVAGKPALTIEEPALERSRIGLQVYAAQRRLDRVSTGGTLLALTDRLLRGDAGSLPILADEPRRYVAWANAPRDAKPGLYRGAITFSVGKRIVAPVEVEVLSVDLPAPASPAGFYLEEAPHLTWFGSTGDRSRQLACDLATLARFGVLGDAPGLAAPDAQGLSTFLQDSRIASSAGVAAPWFAYEPLKRLVDTLGVDAAADRVKAALAALQAAGLPAPIWSLFDEPGNLGGGDDAAATVAAKLRAAAPGIQLGGQFNTPSDRRYLGVVDVALVNPGFGVDARTIEGLKSAGRGAWLYNTGAPRFTAGLWLWRTGASRYLQWHARMPTADPYDPTDGREGDVQVFPPMAEVCAAHPDIDLALIEMAEGVVDQRWLQWLAARPEPEARGLLAQILRETPGDWATASSNGAAKAAKIRESILTFARGLQ